MPIRDLPFSVLSYQAPLAGSLILVAYLCGSIPFGVLIARAKGVDIQKVGSGNIGATNVARSVGARWGFLVFALDFLKGLVPTLVARMVGPSLGDGPFLRFDLPVLCALAAVLGHVFSVWLRFRGGKAGATGLGVGAVVCWQAMVAAAVVWIIVFAITRYVSLGTILGSLAYVLAVMALVIFHDGGNPFDRSYIARSVFCMAVAALVILRHKDNIRRLVAGTESKV
jgi:glycerol-3-phosphate acyltransferase PlsY